MKRRQDKTNKSKAVAVAVLFFALVGLVVFKSGIVESNVFKSKPRFDTALLPSVDISGPVKLRDLKLSPSEIKKLNLTALKYRNTFEAMDIHLNYTDKNAGREVVDNTVLEMNVRFQAEGGHVVARPREVARKDMVGQMVKCVAKAASEFDRYKRLDGAKETFQSLYL